MSGIIVDNTAKSSGLVKASSTGAGVSWQSSIQTSNFTAENGKGYFIDTSSSAITVTLPSSPSAGNLISFKDYAATFGTNNLTIARNGEKIQGVTANSVISTNRASITCLYVDSAEGWVFTQEYNVASLPAAEFISASGGTITTCGNYKIHTFNSSGTFTVCSVGNACGSNTVDYMVVAGGGAGGAYYGAGGGGAGGFRESVPSPAAWTASPLANPGGALPVSAQGYPITIGGGGAGRGAPAGDYTPANAGNNSVFSTITASGGGGGNCINAPNNPAGSGGSGGGVFGGCTASGGAGNTPPVSPPQGNRGGNATNYSPEDGSIGSGGGGATTVGANGRPGTGNGGTGATTSISGSPTTFAGGGGGGGAPQQPGFGSGGSGGGGDGGPGAPPGLPGATMQGDDATANTGGGGGGGGGTSANRGGNGGSGKVIIRYKFQ